MKRPNQKGISMLELLIAIAVIAILVRIAMPLLPSTDPSKDVSKETSSLRIALQSVLDASWSQGGNIALVRTPSGVWESWRVVAGQWQKHADIFSEGSNLRYTVETNSGQLKSASMALGFNKGATLYFLASGEYLPFTITISSGSGSKKAIGAVYGDGIHEIKTR